MDSTNRRDRGSMTILVVAVTVAVVAAVTLAIIPVLTALVDRQHAASAADASALAGVTGGRPAATALAEANHAELVGWSIDDRSVTVRVRVGDQTVIARATDAP
ncbi:MAG: pilus assembly protein TadG-related protein [Ilumatobacteraceae bacterium]